MLGTLGLHYLFPFKGKFLFKAVGILSLSKYCWTLELDCFVRREWFALPVFFCDEKFLLEADGILNFSTYSWTDGLQIVLLGTHGLHYLFTFVMKNS